jgi:glycosyltransferase involved in cell wall biosynthesis
MKKLSVIIPVYNVEKYLCQCVDSVLRELPENSEILLVDDGSTDSSGKICDDYKAKDERIRVFHQKNSGVSSARNKGIEVSEGEKLFFLDSDDYLAENALEQLLQYDSELVIGNYCAFYSDKTANICGEVDTVRYDSIADYFKDFSKYFPTIFNFPWGRIYSAEIIKKANLKFREDISMGEDLLFNLEYYDRISNVQVVSNIIVNYRQSEGSLTKKYNPKLFEWYLKCYSETEAILRKYNSFSTEIKDYFYNRFLGNVYECIYQITSGKGKQRGELLYEIICDERTKKAAEIYKGQSMKMRIIAYIIRLKSAGIMKIYMKIYLGLARIKRKL